MRTFGRRRHERRSGTENPEDLGRGDRRDVQPVREAHMVTSEEMSGLFDPNPITPRIPGMEW